MFAVIKSGGRQYKVSVGQTIEVNRLPFAAGEEVRFEEVLLISDADNSMIGTPAIDGATVVATVARQGRGEKLIVFRYKSKKRHRHRRGHRQELTFLTIDDVIANGKSLVTGEAPRERQVAPIEEVEGASEQPDTSDQPVASEEKKTRRRRTAQAEDAESTATEE